MLQNRAEAVQFCAAHRVADHRLILHADQVVETRLAQSQDSAFHLPGCRVRAGHRKVPGDIVFEDGGDLLIQRLGHPRQAAQANGILDYSLRLRVKYGNFRSGGHLGCTPMRLNDGIFYRATIVDHTWYDKCHVTPDEISG